MATTIADLLGKLGLDTTAWSAGLSKADTEAKNKLGALDSKLQSISKSFGATGNALSVAITAAGVAIGAVALHAGKQIEDANRTIRLGTGATGEALKSLQDSFKNVFARVPADAQTASRAIADLATRTGQTGAALENLAEQEIRLAKAAGTDLVPLIAATTRVFGDWSIATDKQSGALDYLYKTSQATGINVTRLTELVVQFGAPMRALGFSFEEAAALMGKWEKEGVNLETVLAGLRFALAKFAAAGREPKQALQEVQAAIKGAKNEAEATDIAFQNFGKRAAVDMSRAIIEGRFNIDELVKSLKESKETILGSAKDVSTLGGQWQLLKNQLTLALEPLGKTLIVALKDIFVYLKPLLSALGETIKVFGTLDPVVQKVILSIAGLAAATGPLLLLIGKFAGAIVSLNLALGTAGLAGVFAIATPLLIAFGVALAGWVVWKAISEITRLNQEMMQLEEALVRGQSATAAQAREIGILESALKRAGKELPGFFDFEGKLKSISQYLDELREAVRKAGAQSDEFRDSLGAVAGSATGLIVDLKKGTITLAEHGSATDKTGASARDAARDYKKLAQELKAAQQSYAMISAEYKRGEASVEEVAAAEARLQAATEAMGREFRAAGEKVRGLNQAMLEHASAVAKAGAATKEAAIFSAWEQTRLVFGYIADESGRLVLQLDALGRASLNLRDIAPPGWLFEQGRIQQQSIAINQLEAAIRSLGENSVTALGERLRLTEQHYQRLKESGIASAREIWRAEKEALEARMRLEQETGQLITIEQKRRLAELEKLTADHVGKTGEMWKAFQQQVSTVLTDLSKSLTKLIWEGGKFKDIMVDSFKEIGKAIMRYLIEEALAELSKTIWKMIREDIGALRKAFAGLFKDIVGLFGGKAVSAAAANADELLAEASTVGGQAATGITTGAAGGAGGGLAGVMQTWVGPISAAANAITGVLQYLQGRRMEQDIGRIEVTSRGILSQMISIQQTLNRYLPWLENLAGPIWKLVDYAKAIYEAIAQGSFSLIRAVGDAATRFADEITGNISSITAIEALGVLTGQVQQTSTALQDANEAMVGLVAGTQAASTAQVAYSNSLQDMLSGPATSSLNAYWESVRRSGKSVEEAINEWIRTAGREFARPLPYQNEYIESLEIMVKKLMEMGWTLEQATTYANLYLKRQNAYLDAMIEGYRKRGMSEEEARKKAIKGWTRQIDLGQNAILTLIGEQLGLGEALRNAPVPGPAGIFGRPPMTAAEARIAEIEELLRETIPNESDRWQEAKRLAEEFGRAVANAMPRVPLKAPWEAVLAFLREHGITDLNSVEEVRRAWQQTQGAMDDARTSMNQAGAQFRNLGAIARDTVAETVSGAVSAVSGGMRMIALAMRSIIPSYEQFLASLPAWTKISYAERMAQMADSLAAAKQAWPGLTLRMMAAAPPHIPSREEYEARYPPGAQWYEGRSSFQIQILGGDLRDREVAAMTAEEIFRQLKIAGRRI